MDRTLLSAAFDVCVVPALDHPAHPSQGCPSVRGPKAGHRELPRGLQDDNAKQTSASSVVEDLDVFSALIKAGQCLAEIHVHYEQQPEYKLTKTEKAGEKRAR